jgi:hypothetical protein
MLQLEPTLPDGDLYPGERIALSPRAPIRSWHWRPLPRSRREVHCDAHRSTAVGPP